MSRLSPDPAEGPDVPPTTSPELADTPAAEDPPAAEEPADAPPPAELLVTPAAAQPADIPTAEEPAIVPGMEEPPIPEEPAAQSPDDAPIAEQPGLAQLARKLTFGQAVVMITGALLFIWGFLPWYSDAGGSANAWSTETIPGLLLTATWVPLLSLAIVIFTAIKVFADGFPDKILGFTWTQLSIVTGLFDVLISLGFLVANRQLGNLGSLNLGIGLILSFVTSLILLAGAVLDQLGMGTEVFSRLRPEELRRPPNHQ